MTLQAMYKEITTPVPMTSDSGKLRLGLITSPAVKVTLFQASAENNEPTWATASIVRVLTKTSGPPAPTEIECSDPTPRQKLPPTFAAKAEPLRPLKTPTITRPNHPATVAQVNTCSISA